MCQKRKMRLVGQSGRMLAERLSLCSSDGEVTGCVVSDLTPLEMETGACGWCVNEQRHLIGLELRHSSEVEGRTRHVMASVCLPLCSICFMNLTADLKLTAR